MTKHTPGPWHVHPTEQGIIMASGSPIALVSMDELPAPGTLMYATEEDQANATLIAAAPVMLALLKAVAGCPQAAPWLARLPFGEGNTWDAITTTLANVEG